MYWMRSFADELTKIAAAGAMAEKALFRYGKPAAAMVAGGYGYHELQKLKKKLELGDMVYRQQYGE